MKVIKYTLQFEGLIKPTDSEGKKLHATLEAKSIQVQTTLSEGRINYNLESLEGDFAKFESDVVIEKEGMFSEFGTIIFSTNDELEFETIDHGYMGPSIQEGLTHGSVMWKITGGKGRYLSATGIITSNFFVYHDGHVYDHQYGIVFIK